MQCVSDYPLGTFSAQQGESLRYAKALVSIDDGLKSMRPLGSPS